MDEFLQAYAIASRILDRPHADPDDDEAVLARQFQRTVEKLGICVTRGPTQDELARWLALVTKAIEAAAVEEASQ